MFLAKCPKEALEQIFLEFLEQRVKLKIFLVIVNSCYVEYYNKKGKWGELNFPE